MRVHVFTTLLPQRMLNGQDIGSRERRSGNLTNGLFVLFRNEDVNRRNVCPTKVGGINCDVSRKSHIGRCMLCLMFDPFGGRV